MLGVSDLLVAADCNGNGHDDATEIAAGEADDCNLNGIPDACEGPGFGFPEAVRLGFASTTRGVVTADFDDDGLVDIAVVYFGGVAVRISERAGEFESFLEVNSPVDTSNPIAWAGGDLDGDGDVDLALLEPARLVVAYNQGDGAFEDGPTMDFVGRLVALAVADFSGDGSDDMVVTEVRNDIVQVILTGADGALQEPVDYAVGDDPRAVGVGDLDGDRVPDIVVLNRLSADLSLLYNDGTGVFSEPVTIEGVGLQPQKLVVAAFTGDGLADVATGDRTEVSVWLNEGERTFGPPAPLATVRLNVISIGSGDIDGDGDADLVASYVQPAGIDVFVNSGAGAFNAGTSLLLPDFSQIVVHDADVNGAHDLVLVPGLGNTITVAWNRQRIDAVPFDTLRTYDSDRPHSADIGDLDGDGDL